MNFCFNGQIKMFPKPVVNDPKDGIHRIKRNGVLHGPKLAMLNDTLMAIGKEMFYCQIGDGKGLKIYYSKAKNKVSTKEHVLKKISKMEDLYAHGLLKKCYGIVDVKILGIKAFGIVVDHVNLPGAWYEFLKGKPYDWKCVDHIDHSVKGYVAFKKRIEKYVGNMKLGDFGWDIIDNRWYLMDVGEV